jgi:hypothetical protein
MTQPLLGPDTRIYKFAGLQWAHLLVGFVMMWYWPIRSFRVGLHVMLLGVLI